MAALKHIILDTDIGTDIDDHWALGMLLNIPGICIDLVLTATANTPYRTALAAKFLEEAGRSDVPVGTGLPGTHPAPELETLRTELANGCAERTKCRIVPDGLGEAVRIIERNEETTIIAIAPMTNLAALLKQRPELAGKCHLVAMAGSIRKNFRDKEGKVAEYNVISDLPAARLVFSGGWKTFTLTPLDHCGNLVLTGPPYQELLHSSLPVPAALIRCYRQWQAFYKNNDNPALHSSILFDTAAVYLATDGSKVRYEEMKLSVDEQGYLADDPRGRTVRVAMAWEDREAYLRHLADILLNRAVFSG